MRRVAALVLLGLAAVPAATASGPSPGVLQGGNGVTSGEAGYSTLLDGGRTRLIARRGGEVVRTLSLRGRWGIPLVTYRQAGGLSHDGRTLVLAQGDYPTTLLRPVSRFLVLDTRHLAAPPRRVTLRGDLAFDALSPHGRMLYLIQRSSTTDLTRYRVRGYDLGARRLLPRVIADRRQASWVMHGIAVQRATSADGRWEFTLYSQPGNYPFVHALDTVTRTAVCIGVPWDWRKPLDPVEMNAVGGKVVLRLGLDRKRFVVDPSAG